MTPEEVLNQVEKSGLRGRGGAGFPTGRKWRSAMNGQRKRGGPVYVVCNGDEGDPGAFMDRTIMEGDPHAVLEGMIIGAYALGCQPGVYLCPGRIPDGHQTPEPSPWIRPEPWGSWERTFWEPIFTLISRSIAGPGPLSAGNPRPFSPPSRVRPGNLETQICSLGGRGPLGQTNGS